MYSRSVLWISTYRQCALILSIVEADLEVRIRRRADSLQLEAKYGFCNFALLVKAENKREKLLGIVQARIDLLHIDAVQYCFEPY